jgi:hypothetical protein
LGTEATVLTMLNYLLLQYDEYAYATVVVAMLAYALFRMRQKSRSVQTEAFPEVAAQAHAEFQVTSQTPGKTQSSDPVAWWNHEDFPYSAPWWLRYPASIGVFAGSYWAFFEWDRKAGCVFGALLVVIGLGLIRELFFGVLLATLAGLALWAVGATVAALPVSIAIIIGAMIIAQAMRR